MSLPHTHPPEPAHEESWTAQAAAVKCKLEIRPISDSQRALSRKDLAAFSLHDALEHDSRPTFAIDASRPTAHNALPDVVYYNPALAGAQELLGKIAGQNTLAAISTDTPHAYTEFLSWLSTANNGQEKGRPNTHLFEGYIWSVTSLGNLKIVSGVPSTWQRAGSVHARTDSSPAAESTGRKRPRHAPQMNRLPRAPVASASTHATSFDYTQGPPPANASGSDHFSYFRTVDWASTSLGPMDIWTPQLRCLANMVLNDSYPAVLFWGQDVAMIYNEAYIELIGFLHPCMGASARVAAPEHWAHFQPLVDYVNATGQTLSEHDMPIFLDRHGFFEETFFSFQFMPVLDSQGSIAGYYQPLVETTKNNLLERRVSSLAEIGSQTAKARNLSTYWDLVLNTLRINDKDAPFALLYATTSHTAPAAPSMSSPNGTSNLSQHYVLKGSVGVESGHPLAPSAMIIDLRETPSNSNILLPYIVQSSASRQPLLVDISDLDLSPDVLSSIDWKGYGDPCRSLLICPIQPTTSPQIFGYLILGLNPRRPFDAEYQQYISVLNRLLATSLASVVFFDAEMQANEHAILQAAHLQEQLNLKEQRFQRFAESADIAIYIINPATRTYIYRNKRWFDIFNVRLEDDDAGDIGKSWTRIVLPEDLAECEALFARLVVDKVPLTVEIKTTIPYRPSFTPNTSGSDSDATPAEKDEGHVRWILCSAYPELGPDGEIAEIVGNVTDISKQKWAESIQKIRFESALESKKHLELFIDSTSHEMRNPLSAIMQCADGILATGCGEDGDVGVVDCKGLLEEMREGAQTIAECAQHMKRIVDDILTISKLDSGLLSITPVPTQPVSIANNAVKMFEAEAKAADVDLRVEMDRGLDDPGFCWVDPTRLIQVLINLITNAIKFTRLAEERRITVSVGASVSKPRSRDDEGGNCIASRSGEEAEGCEKDVDMSKSDRNRRRQAVASRDHGQNSQSNSNLRNLHFISPALPPAAELIDDWKHGETIYIVFSVKDTGPGLSEEEASNLFARFSQASPRTHVNYGGSGLGLFISKRLTEMQGGAIGLSSETGSGSTFAFYIKARRVQRTDDRREALPAISPQDVRHGPSTPREVLVRSSLRGRNGAIAGGLVGFPIPDEEDGSTSPTTLPDRAKSSIRELEGLHILVVEDNIVNQKVLTTQLKKLGAASVSVANHGGECLDYLKGTTAWNHTCCDDSTADDGDDSIFNDIGHNDDGELDEVEMVMKPEKGGMCDSGVADTYDHNHNDEGPRSLDGEPDNRNSAGQLPVELNLILMDWEMPIMSGLECARRIRALQSPSPHCSSAKTAPDLKKSTETQSMDLSESKSRARLLVHIPIIGVTANAREKQVKQALEAGMDNVVSKPFRIGQLVECIHDLLGRRGDEAGRARARAIRSRSIE